MPKILCTLPNASAEISGVKFVSHADGMVSEDVSDAVAEGFLAITGYTLADNGAAEREAAEKAAAAEAAAAEKAAAAEAAAAEKAALLERAAAIDFKVKANWSVERLTTEVEAAEKAAAEAKAAAAKTE